ncbi:MAG: FG-GAP-like repeat-containing protein, partial [Cyclobacteriaceae bacterium]|nr:FG-GAP-like repeat-containing protein [Cyclobacteriaceae bacterium]
TIKLKSDKPVWGAKVKIVYGRGEQYYEVLNSRGYKSSGSTLVHFGLNETNRIDSLCVFWPDGTRTAIENVLADRQMVIEQSHTGNNTNQAVQVSAPYRLFKEVTGQRGLLYRHAEKAFDDFKYGPLLPHKLSGLGPFISQGDVNGDGMNDIFVGGEAFKSGVFFVREEKGSFKQQDLNLDATNEDMGSLLFDADGDGDQDLYVVSGSNEFKARSAYTDRLYVNDGRGNYSRAFDALPQAFESGSVVEGIDFDRDGDTDLFVGGRQKPFRYPSPASSFLLRNDSKEKDKPKFTDVTKEMAPELPDIGMVTDAIWADYDNDQDDDLIITGEWMGIYVFENDKGKFRNVTKDIIPPQLEGWYNCIVAADFDQDGDLDLVAGNRGGNYQNEVSVRNPLELFYGDFDLNGREDVVCSYSRDGVRYPLHDRDISALQIPSLTTRFPTYQSFATASFEEIYGKESLMTSIYLKAHNFQSIYLENRGKDHGFITHPLPIEAQFSAINDIVIIDVDNDGMKDMIIAGNNYDVEVRVPGNDAGIGLVLINKGNNEFAALDAMGSGLFLNENVRDLEIMAVGEEKWLVAMVNNGMMRVFKLGHFGSVH